MKRRNFFKTSLIGAAGVGAGLSIGYFAIPTYRTILKNILEKDLSKLKIKAESIDRFIEDALTENAFGHSFAKKEMIRFYYYIANGSIPLPYKYKYDQYRADIVGKFLLSTNFFINKMDETKEVEYSMLYNPYKFPCGNPFSNLYYPLI